MNPEFLVTELGHDLFPLLMVALLGIIGLLVSLPTVLIIQIRRFKERQLATRIVMEMLSRNATIDEINDVLNAWASGTQSDLDRMMHQRLSTSAKPPVAKSAPA